MNKIEKVKLELEERKLEIQERKALLKENKEKIELEKKRIIFEKADQLRWALSTPFILNDSIDSTKSYGFSQSEFLVLMKKYYNILKEL